MLNQQKSPESGLLQYGERYAATVHPVLGEMLKLHQADSGVKLLPDLLECMGIVYGQPKDKKYGLVGKPEWALTAAELSQNLRIWDESGNKNGLPLSTQIALLHAMGVMAEHTGQLRRSPVYKEWESNRRGAMVELATTWAKQHGSLIDSESMVVANNVLGWPSNVEHVKGTRSPKNQINLPGLFKESYSSVLEKIRNSVKTAKETIAFALTHPKLVVTQASLITVLAACGAGGSTTRPEGVPSSGSSAESGSTINPSETPFPKESEQNMARIIGMSEEEVAAAVEAFDISQANWYEGGTLVEGKGKDSGVSVMGGMHVMVRRVDGSTVDQELLYGTTEGLKDKLIQKLPNGGYLVLGEWDYSNPIDGHWFTTAGAHEDGDTGEFPVSASASTVYKPTISVEYDENGNFVKTWFYDREKDTFYGVEGGSGDGVAKIASLAEVGYARVLQARAFAVDHQLQNYNLDWRDDGQLVVVDSGGLRVVGVWNGNSFVLNSWPEGEQGSVAKVEDGVISVDGVATNVVGTSEVGVDDESLSDVLGQLDLDAKDHESLVETNYHFETIEWMGQQIRALVHDDPEVDGERIDGMEVTINGVKQWVRGIHYPVEGFGGMNVDVWVHPLQERRAFFTNPEGPQAVYGELLTAIAHQLGMSQEGLQNHLAANDNKVTVRLPQFWNPDNHSKNRSPSYLQASPLVTINLRKPVVYATRSGVIEGQEVAPGVTVPEGIRFVVGDSNAGIAVFVANEQLFVVYESDQNMTSDREGTIANRLLRAFETIAMMNANFVDSLGDGNSVLEKISVAAGKNYRDGDLILDRNVFYTTLPDYSDFDFTVFELK